MPKQGDRVRATLGDNVLVGEVVNTFPNDSRRFYLSIDNLFEYEIDGRWTVEVLHEIPFLVKVGKAVVIDRNESLWVYNDVSGKMKSRMKDSYDYWQYDNKGEPMFYEKTWEDLVNRRGPVQVLEKHQVIG